MSDLNTNFNVPAPAGITIAVKKVDSGTQDNRKDPVAASMDEIKNPPMPREGMRQAPLSGKQSPSAPVNSYQNEHR